MADSNVLKILIAGELKTGKTSLLSTEVVEASDRKYVPTIGIDFSVKQMIINDKVVKLQLWDSSGDEKYKSILATYCRGLHGVLVVYDVTAKETFDKVEKWLNFLHKHCSSDVQYFLIGNKADLNERTVTKQQGEEFAKQHSMEFHEISSLDANKMKAFFMSITQMVLSRQTDENKLRRRAAMAPGPSKKSSLCTLL